jgi:uncharacterized protein YabE (DUF348 family)
MPNVQRTVVRVWVPLVVAIAVVVIGFVGRAVADDGSVNNQQRMITIYDRGVEQTIITKAGTVREALQQADISIDAVDLVEPRLDAQLVAEHYNVNIYRARPIIVEDGTTKIRTITAAQSPSKIAHSAGVTLYPEDKTDIKRVDDVVTDGGAGLKLTIDRATPFTFVLYGKKLENTRTQATTVADMLKEKNVKLGPKDGISVPLSTGLVAGMSVEVWRNGVQTVTNEEEVPMPIEQVKDQDRAKGFHEIRTPGKPGKKQVTYEINMQNGIEVSRRVIQSVTTLEPVKQIEVIGAKGCANDPNANRVIGHQLMLAAGFGEDQWTYLDKLWSHESGWIECKANYGGSGAYGIPQALPGSKMGEGWQEDPVVQIRWGLNYIKDRYGTPQGAYTHWQTKNWY